MQTGELRAKLVGHENSVYAVRFMNDMRGLVSGSLDCSVKFWDVSGLQDAVPDDSKTARSRAERGMVTCPVIKSFIGHRVRSLQLDTLIFHTYSPIIKRTSF